MLPLKVKHCACIMRSLDNHQMAKCVTYISSILWLDCVFVDIKLTWTCHVKSISKHVYQFSNFFQNILTLEIVQVSWTYVFAICYFKVPRQTSLWSCQNTAGLNFPISSLYDKFVSRLPYIHPDLFILDLRKKPLFYISSSAKFILRKRALNVNFSIFKDTCV